MVDHRTFGLVTLALIATLLGSAHAQDGSLECYQFTWPGVYNMNGTEEIDVDDMCEELPGSFNMPKGSLPCYTPFVYTIPSNRPPNITELNDICSTQYCENYKCSTDKQCMKWSMYDVTGNIVYYSSFCGSMSDNTVKSVAAKPINNECWNDVNITFTKESCTCDTPLCNTGNVAVQPAWAMLPFIFATLYAFYYN